MLRAFERNLMFERKEGKVYAAEELAEASNALMAARHTEMRDAGKEIGKLLSASNRVVKVRGRAAGRFALRRLRVARCACLLPARRVMERSLANMLWISSTLALLAAHSHCPLRRARPPLAGATTSHT